jgi:hypothetical protein
MKELVRTSHVLGWLFDFLNSFENHPYIGYENSVLEFFEN